MMSMCQRRRLRAPQLRLSKRRIMHSTGHNITSIGVPDKHRRFLSDLYTTLIDIQWRWNILIFVSGFVITWLLFACFYYLLSYVHGDLDDHDSEDFIPCVENVKSFTAAYLFSIETMTTIGYGSRSQTEECPGVYLAVMLQSIIGAGLQFMLASIVVSKTRRAKRRSETFLFSDHVCIYEQDTKLQMVVRVGDMRTSEIAGAHAQGYLVKKYRSKDGTFVPVRSYNMSFKSECGRDEIFFPWPVQIVHVVDEDSPLWSLSRDELLNGKHELIVVVDGVSGTTSQSFQARKSYHSSEMVWGHRFSDLDLTCDSNDNYVMNLANFHHTVPVSTPLCSAQDITQLRDMYQANHPGSDVAGTVNPSRPKSHSPDTDATPGSSTTALSSEGNNDSHPHSKSAAAIVKRALRSRSMDESNRSAAKDVPKRRCSLGDMIRDAHGGDTGLRKNRTLGDALNIYRHRRSVTDTYLGAEIEEEDEDCYESNQAILSVVSQRSVEKRTDVRDVFKRRRNSVQLMFGTESGKSGEEEDESPQSPHSPANLSWSSQKSTTERRADVRDVFKRRKSSVQLFFVSEPGNVIEEH